MKTLIFEGAGCTGTKKNDVDNCRIRTRLMNRDGRIIYLELGGTETGKYTPPVLKQFTVSAHIDHCFYCDEKEDLQNNHSAELARVEKLHYEYTQKNIVEMVNKELNCDFDNMTISGNVRVHDTTEPLSFC
jgi:hypothetical protein